MAINEVILIGRLTKAPELVYTKNNVAVTTFTLAVDKRRREDGANFIRVKCFNKTAENVDRYLDKGRQAAVRGSFDTYIYEKDGRTAYVTEVLADQVEFLGGSSDAAPQPQANSNVSFEDLNAPDTFEAATEDIPF